MLCAVVFVLACTPTARAESPSATRSTAVLTDGGAALATARFDTVLGPTAATATASASTLTLRTGGTYRIRTCIWHKATAIAPQSVCESREVKIDLRLGLRGVAAPQAQMHVQRPAAGQPAATIAATVLVDQLDAGAWASLASSWPSEGMRVAGLAVPAVDQTSGEVIGSHGVPLDGVRSGGINTFAQDSICRETEIPGTSAARGSTDALGALPFAYEVQEPVGAPQGTILILHGGAWHVIGRGALATTRGEADRWLARGWRTVNASYRGCSSSSDDVAALLDRVHAVYGNSRPVCASGQSAGAHLALLLAVFRPRLACVVAQAGPGDLAALAAQTAPDASASGSQLGPRRVANMAIAAFGDDRLASLSPTRQSVRARVLFAIGAGDSLIPWEQAEAFAAAQRARDPKSYVDTLQLPEGPIHWIHALVSQAGLDELSRRENLLVAPLTTTTVRTPASVRSEALKRRGLTVGFSCPSACSVRVLLRRGDHSIASAQVRRATFGRGRAAVRVRAHHRTQLERGRIDFMADVRAEGAVTRIRRSIEIR